MNKEQNIFSCIAAFALRRGVVVFITFCQKKHEFHN